MLEESGQISIYDLMAEKKIDKRLLALSFDENGTPKEMCDVTPEDIFKGFTSFTGVTYSVSPVFINKYFSSYDSLNIVIGIPESGYQLRTAAALANRVSATAHKKAFDGESMQTFEKLTAVNKDKVIDAKWQLYFSSSVAIHSKYYLLSDESGRHRVVYGSANLSAQAFEKEYPQVETIMIFDHNEELYQILLDNFNSVIQPLCIPYFSKKMLSAFKKSRKKGTREGGIAVHPEAEGGIAVSPAETDEKGTGVYMPLSEDATNALKVEQIENIEKDVVKQVNDRTIPDTVWEERKQELSPEAVKERKNENIKNEQIFELQKEVVTSDKKKARPVSAEKLERIVKEKTILKVTVSDRQEDSHFSQPMLISKPEARDMANGITGLFVPSADKTTLLPFGQEITDTKTLKDSLAAINRFVESYRKYGDDVTDEYMQRIMEVILYAFTSPFLSEIRGKITSDNDSSTQVPNFLILGAAAGAGKTQLLNAAQNLTRLSQKDEKIIAKEILGAVNGSQHQFFANVLSMMMRENHQTTYPIYLDEMPPEEFEKSAFTDMIKDVTNMNLHGETLAPLILTTNADDISMKPEIERRVYYIAFDHVITDTGEAAEKDLHNMQKALNSTLFKDFICRMAEKLADDTIDWKHYIDNADSMHNIDFLYQTRVIFQRYYAEANMVLPEWFPTNLFTDSAALGEERWHDLYISAKDSFKLYRINDTDVLTVAMKDVLPMTETAYGKTTQATIKYTQSIPRSVLYKEKGKGSHVNNEALLIDAQAFYKWAGIPKNLQKKTSFFTKIKSRV